jgi:hypothetical protein
MCKPKPAQAAAIDHFGSKANATLVKKQEWHSQNESRFESELAF